MGEICYLMTDGKPMSDLQQRLLELADGSYEFTQRTRDIVSVRAHNRALALQAAKLALALADADRARMHNSIVSLRGLCISAAGALHATGSAQAKREADNLFGMLGEIEGAFKPLVDHISP